MKNGLIIALLCFSLIGYSQKKATKKEIKIKPKAEFVAELMAKMTVDEKIYQTVQFTSDGTVTGPKSGDNYITRIQQGKVGSILNATGAKATREIQRINLENSRLKIPLLFGHDVIHGYKTIFPINLGMASSWDPKAVELAARVAAIEAGNVGRSAKLDGGSFSKRVGLVHTQLQVLSEEVDSIKAEIENNAKPAGVMAAADLVPPVDAPVPQGPAQQAAPVVLAAPVAPAAAPQAQQAVAVNPGQANGPALFAQPVAAQQAAAVVQAQQQPVELLPPPVAMGVVN